MSYRIDGETPYWGGKSLSDPLVPPSEEVMEAMGRLLAKELTKYKLEMGEKKTKRMTKAEAFEWLRGKRVVCDDYNSETIQRKLFEVGMKWRGGITDVVDFGAFIFVDLKGCLTHCNSREWFDTHAYEEIKADDILSLEIEDECAKCGDGEYAANKISLLGSQICEILRQMNGHYHVEITEDSVNLYAEGVNLYYSEPF